VEKDLKLVACYKKANNHSAGALIPLTSALLQKRFFMATFRDPIQCFAPLEVVERLLEIRADLGFTELLYMPNTSHLADFLDAHGFDSYVFTSGNPKIDYGLYRSPLVPGGDKSRFNLTAH